MAESIGNSGTGMKLHTKILIALAVGATTGILANLYLGGASPTVVWGSTNTSRVRWARYFCACCSWW